MPYLIKGNAQQIFHAFGQDWAVVEGKDDTETIHLDFSRTDFLGTPEQAQAHLEIWSQHALSHYYLQGNMSAGNLHYLFGIKPMMKEGEDPESYNANLVRQHFAYMDDKGVPCGLMVMYRKDNPKHWMMGLVQNGQAKPKDREIVILSSFDPTPFISTSEIVSPSVDEPKINVSYVNFLNNPLLEQINATLPKSLLADAVHSPSSELDLRFQRVKLMTRTLQVQQETATLIDPISFYDLNLPALFADNRALDLIIQYNFATIFPLSSKLFADLLSDSSSLRKEIESIKLTEDHERNITLIKMVLVFYKYGMLDNNRHLINDPLIMQSFGNLMVNEAQIKLLPFLKQKNYPDEVIRFILSQPAYFKAIGMLVDLEPALTQHVRTFLKDSKKLDDLKFIHSITNEDCKRLCLLFWVEANLSEDGYQEIVTATQKYPLLASTLVALKQTKTITIEDLKLLALNPQRHLQKTIRHHFFDASDSALASLSKLSLPDLEAATESLILLKKAKITDRQAYRWAVDKDSKGQALRIFLPQLAKLKNDKNRQLLIEVLLVGIKSGIPSQGKRVLEIKNSEQLALAKQLNERFICVRQMQDLKLTPEIFEFAAQENSEEAKRFRRIILSVEEQCKIVYERLSSSISHRDVLQKWNQAEGNYRKTLYQIAFDGLTKPHIDISAKLQDAEDKILAIVDPKIDSEIYKALIVCANIIITALSFSVANIIKYKTTGNFWFFNQTKSGEELRALDKEVFRLIEPEKEDEIGCFATMIPFCS